MMKTFHENSKTLKPLMEKLVRTEFSISFNLWFHHSSKLQNRNQLKNVKCVFEI